MRDAIEVLNERSHEEEKADSQAPLSLWSADFADLLQKQISMPDGEELQEDEEEPEQGDEQDQDEDDEDDELAQEEDQDQDQEMQDDGVEVLTAA